MKGPVALKESLKNKLILVPRERVHVIMLQHAPEGFNCHLPGNMRQKINHKPLTSVGPFQKISADGYEKLNQQALNMGDLNIPIYPYKDKWSGMILKLCTVPDSCTAGAVGHLYLDLVQEWEGIPLQLMTDKGLEIGWQATIQSIFRSFYAPTIDMEVFPPFVTIPSTQNTVIKSLWWWLGKKTGFNLKDTILIGKHEHYFHAHDPMHHNLFYWIFIPLIQEELNWFHDYWNNHRIRKQAHKTIPSSHSPADALCHPSLF
ncbi:hypothetical protein P691DRAFT_846664 [Macrolepiota fuliginosa MF-IS2]|uniref:Integrase core domain-containing protein n=1 Tax=Macrolepiota fuliginosa MF-IS2 TaxID=1400762 RepID=A0A9P5XHJ6_9AGAR|nr:hypothetical protein P691DRAFT_846664 [Macrolepiota fuliginosa MF-IS2]